MVATEHSTDVNGRVEQAISDLLGLDLDGCITGSCVLANDFNAWDTVPDVDFFAYSEASWLHAVTTLLSRDRYTPGSKKDIWKYSRVRQGRNSIRNNKRITQTIYVYDTETGIYLNLSYKPGCQNITDVLSRFDSVAIMLGICCRTKRKIDLRYAFLDINKPFRLDNIGAANPIRLWYMAEGWDEATWSRELARIAKYEARGFSMRQMARDLIGVAARVLDRGEVVGSEKSKARYLNLMMSCYRPVIWLENFVYSKGENVETSAAIAVEIRKLINDLPEDVQDKIWSDLRVMIEPCGDKMFQNDLDLEDDDDTEAPDR